jgi:hypothetical protein
LKILPQPSGTGDIDISDAGRNLRNGLERPVAAGLRLHQFEKRALRIVIVGAAAAIAHAPNVPGIVGNQRFTRVSAVDIAGERLDERWGVGLPNRRQQQDLPAVVRANRGDDEHRSVRIGERPGQVVTGVGGLVDRFDLAFRLGAPCRQQGRRRKRKGKVRGETMSLSHYKGSILAG